MNNWGNVWVYQRPGVPGSHLRILSTTVIDCYHCYSEQRTRRVVPAGMRCPECSSSGMSSPQYLPPLLPFSSLLILPFLLRSTHIHPDHFRSCQASSGPEKFMQQGLCGGSEHRCTQYSTPVDETVAQCGHYPMVGSMATLDQVTILLFLWSRFLAPGSSKSKLIIWPTVSPTLLSYLMLARPHIPHRHTHRHTTHVLIFEFYSQQRLLITSWVRFLCKSSDFSLDEQLKLYIFLFILDMLLFYCEVSRHEFSFVCILLFVCFGTYFQCEGSLFFPVNFRKVSLSLQILPPLPCSALYLVFHLSLLDLLILVNKLFLEQF